VTHFTEQNKSDTSFDAPSGDYYFSIAVASGNST